MTAVHVLGQWHTEASRYVRISGAWRRVTGIALRVGGIWKTATGYTPAFTASAPDEVDGSQYTAKPTQTPVMATGAITVSGGQPPYSYSWTKVSGDSRIAAQSPGMASTQFSANLRSETAQAVFQWQASDALGQTATGQTTVVLSAGSDF